MPNKKTIYEIDNAPILNWPTSPKLKKIFNRMKDKPFDEDFLKKIASEAGFKSVRIFDQNTEEGKRAHWVVNPWRLNVNVYETGKTKRIKFFKG
jgi:hypothetical protein